MRAAAAVGELRLVSVRRELMTTFDIGRCFGTGTAGTGKFRLSSEGRGGATCTGMGARSLGSAGTAGVTGTGEIDFMLFCSFPLIIAFVLIGCDNLSFDG